MYLKQQMPLEREEQQVLQGQRQVPVGREAVWCEEVVLVIARQQLGYSIV